MNDLLDLLRTAVSRHAPSPAISGLVDACERSGANYEQIIGACAAGLAMRDSFASETAEEGA